jgi:hypothetical protein
MMQKLRMLSIRNPALFFAPTKIINLRDNRAHQGKV